MILNVDIGPMQTAVTQSTSAHQLEQACAEFESFFVAQLMKSKQNFIPEQSPLSSSNTNMYSELLQNEYAKGIAMQSLLGIATSLTAELGNKEVSK